MSDYPIVFPPALVPQGVHYAYSSAIGDFVIGFSPIGIVPMVGPPLTKTIPSYLYWQYQDDDDLQAFVAAYNTMTQAFVDWFNSINLPIYTGTQIFGSLLDWVATGLYGLARPVLGSGTLTTKGPYDTFLFDELAFDGFEIVSNAVYTPTTDDVYKRVLTWHFFKGYGKILNVQWLKRRIVQFLVGTNGVDAFVDSTYQISVSFGLNGQVNVTLLTHLSTFTGGAVFDGMGFGTTLYDEAHVRSVKVYDQYLLAQTFKQAIEQGVLETPFQYNFVVVVQP